MRNISRPTFIKVTSHQAFTLIELLVVISIIAVLAGLLLPVGNKVIDNGKKVSAKSAMVTIVNAVKNYQAEYGTYPVYIAPAAGGAAVAAVDTTFITGVNNDTDGKHNGVLFTVLRAQNNLTGADPNLAGLNTRRIVYFEYKDAKNPAAPKDGFVPAPANGNQNAKDATGAVTLATGDLMDPWGNLYAIRIDTGYSDKVMDPMISGGEKQADDASADDSKVVHTSVIAWSIGSKNTLYQYVSPTGPAFESSGNVATWK